MSEAVTFPRLKSLDALRGFDMLWIIGGEAVIFALAKYYSPNLNWLSEQMRHVGWEGFRFYDLIFPLFVFIAGVSMAFSMEKHRLSGRGDRSVFIRLTRRMVLLVFLGLVYNGLMNFKFAELRYCSVLGLIGISTYIAGLIALKTRHVWPVLAAACGIWLTVFIIQKYLTIGDLGGGNFSQEKIINRWFDSFIPGKIGGGRDPEGPLNIFSAAFLPLVGCAVGRLLLLYRETRRRQWINAAILAAAGCVLIGLACALSPAYPIIKKAWTGSFNLMTAGSALILFAAFHAVIDLLKFEKWSFPFQVIGVNAITVYLGYRFFDYQKPAKMLFSGIGELTGDFKPVILSFAVVLIQWLILFLFYRKKIFVKL